MAREKSKENTRVAVDLEKHPEALKAWRDFCKKHPWLATEAARIGFLLENFPAEK